jgi:3-methyladenine DNA glycosylase AlkC
MPEKLKDLFFTTSFVNELGDTIQEAYPDFDKDEFNGLVFDGSFDTKELKEKMRHITHCLYKTLPQDYPEALAILTEVAPSFQGFDGMVFSDYVGCYGLDDWDVSLPALAFFTKYISAEYAIRPFLAQDPERAMEYVREWAEDENEHVRRLASEGCRPRLPWGMALVAFKEEPSLILPVLEKLKDDESEFVRRSVANNLNDISKDHPEVVLDICERWYGDNKNTDWIVKHACRGMLKAGDERAMRLFGFADPKHIRVEKLSLDKERLTIGEDQYFTLDLSVDTDETCKVRLEFAVDYARPKGKRSRKVFHLREANLEPGTHTIVKKLSLADQSTRKHYPGEHQISIIVNGIEMAQAAFELEENVSNEG